MCSPVGPASRRRCGCARSTVTPSAPSCRWKRPATTSGTCGCTARSTWPGRSRARGWPAHARGAVDFSLTDPLADWNTGTWRLAVADGAAELTRIDGDADLRLDVRGFALLYAGAAHARSVAQAGLLHHAAGVDPAALDLLGAGGPAQLLDYF